MSKTTFVLEVQDLSRQAFEAFKAGAAGAEAQLTDLQKEVAQASGSFTEFQTKLAGAAKFTKDLNFRVDSIGKTGHDLLELQAAQLGVANTAKPLIDRLREAEAASKSGAAAAGQLAGAMHQETVAGMSWVEFLKGRMGPAMREFGGDHKAAIQKLSAEYAEYKRTGQAALVAVADTTDKAGTSTKAMSFAMRQVPMQFTDIFTSLAAGQRPMMVFLQQGGQLKDLFGGIGPAARALGGYVLGLVNPFTVTAAAVGLLTYAYLQGSKESREFQNALILSGNAVGMSANQYAQLRDELAGIAGTRGKASEALTEIARSGMFAGDQLKAIGETAVLLEKSGGPAINKTVEQFKRLAEEPAKASAELNKQTHYLTAAVYEQIKALEEQGDKAAAGALAMQTYADAQAKAAKQVIDNAGWLEISARGVGNAWKWTWDQILGIGRDKTGAEQLSDFRRQLAAIEGARGTGPADNAFAGAKADQLRSQIALLERLNAQVDANAKAEGKRAQANQEAQAAIDAVTQQNEKGLSKQQQMNKALDAYRANIDKIRSANPDSALLDPKKIAAAEKAIREQFSKATQPFVSTGSLEAAKQYAKYFEEFRQLEIDATASTGELTKAQAKLVQYLTSPAYANASEEMRQINLQQAYAAISAEQLAGAQKEAAKAYAEFSKAQAESESRSLSAIAKRVAELRNEAETYGMLESQIQRTIIARLEEAARGVTNSDDMESLRTEIEARKELVTMLEGKELREANKKAADDGAKAWKETGDFIERTLLDSVQAGFRHGENFGKAFFKSLEATAKTTVLRFGVQMVGQGITGMMQPGGALNSLAGAFGLGGSATSYGGSNALSMLANGYSLAGMGTSAAGLVGSGVGAIFGGAAGNAALGASLGLGTASSAAAASAAAAAGGTSAAGAGLGASLGSAVPYIGAALLVASMFSGGGETRSGAEYEGTRKIRGPSGGEIGGDQTRAAIQSTQDSINNTLRALGSSATVEQINSGLESSGKGKGFAYAGGTLSTGASFGQSTSAEGRANRRGSMSAEQAGAAFGEELKQATLQALQAADVPGQLGDYLRQLGDIDKLSGGALDAAIGRINKALSEKDQLEAQIFAMTATSLEQLNKTREKERAAIDSSNAALLEHVYALQDQQQAAAVLVDAYNRENAALQQTIDRHRDYAEQLREFRDSLLLGEDSPLGPRDRTLVALSQYDQTYARAQAGDLEAIAGLQDASTAYLGALKGSAASAVEYNAGFAKVMSGLTLTAAASDAAATVGQSQLSVATEQLTQLGLINTNLVSFQDALAGYLAAVANTKSAADAAAAIAAAPAAAPDGQTTWSKLHDRVDETIKKMGPGGGSGAVLNGIVDEVAGGGSGAILNYIPQFATGGMYLGGARIVGEDGPELEVTGPARIYSASQTREILRPSSDAAADEIRQLRAQVAQLLEAARSSAQHAYRAAKVLDQLHVRGVQIRDRDDQTVPAVHVV